MNKKIDLSEIITFLNDEIKFVYGNPKSIYVFKICNSENTEENSLDWISTTRSEKQKVAENSKAKVIIANSEVKYSETLKKQGKVLVLVANPRLSIAKIGNKFFREKIIPQIHPSATIHPNAKLGEKLFIGPNTVVGNCEIGNNCIILGNSYVYDNVIIKNNVEIHSGCSIGSEAHNFVQDNNNMMVKFPHLGRLIIEDDVIIGANSVISRGVLEDTVIKKGTKIAQLVIIGANNNIGENCAIRANVMTSGSVKVGRNTIIAPSATVREYLSIGENCLIGMGAIVTKNVPSNETWVGNPAKKFIK